MSRLLWFPSVVAVFVWRITTTSSHPQCLNFRPPFDSISSLSFCSEYSDFGCCNVERNAEIRSNYERIKRVITSLDNGLDECDTYLKDLLCQECSPYAAHVFDAEASGIVDRRFPGLCQDYCSDFYDKCRGIVPFIDNATQFLNALSSKAQFCQAASVSDNEYCFPELLTNSRLNGDIDITQRTTPGCLCLEEFAQGLANPVVFRAPQEDERIFIAEQVGIVHIYFKNKTKISTPFMDISDLVLTSSRNGDERGFLGMTFHPNFNANQKVYVYYSTENSGEHHIRISEFTVNSTNRNAINRTSERVLLEEWQPFWNHNGGEILFGTDNFLYAFIGDGGSAGDPLRAAQNKTRLLGKVIRIDVDRTDPVRGREYGIPPDNPFINDNQAHPEIYAYGIRNIWRCDVDEGHPQTGYGRGRIFCGDVGQNRFEEIDIIERGGNYGWNSREGFQCYNSDCGKIGPEVLPIHAYPHSEGQSVTGGHVYRGCANPNLQGQYIYGDFVVGALWSLTEDEATGNWTNKNIYMCGSDVCFNGLTGRHQRNILSFGEDQDGELYMLTTNFASPTSASGRVYKFVDPKRSGDPSTCRTYKPPTTETSTTNPSEVQTTTLSSSNTQQPPVVGDSAMLHTTSSLLLLLVCLFNLT